MEKNKVNKIHLRCFDCGSSDALSDFGDHTYCFSCGVRHNKLIPEKEDFFQEAVKPILTIDTAKIIELADRRIAKASAEKYGVWVNDAGEQIYPYFDSKTSTEHIASKIRLAGRKGFIIQGNWPKAGLFGQQVFPPGSAKQVTIVEGELDALSAFEMLGSKYPVVSVKSASEAPKSVADSFDYLNSFETIVICFDKDEPHKKPDGSVWYPGQEAATKCAGMFSLGKVRLMTLREAKDANDYLRAGWVEKFKKEWWDAPIWTPTEIRLIDDLWDEIKEVKSYESVPYPWDGLQRLTYGLRLSELVVFTADTGIGKTSVIKEIEHYILRSSPYGVGILHLEETNKETGLGLMSISANRPLHLPDVREKVEEAELRRYFDDTYRDKRVVVWNHFGSNEIEDVLATVRHMYNLGCRYIFIDHLSIVVSDQRGDERKQLDEVSTKLKMMAMELAICIVCVIHQNRKGEIRGTAGVEQLANIVIKLYRDIEADDDMMRNTTKLVVQKNRFCGRTGPACLLHYDASTGRLSELSEEEMKRILATGTSKDEW